MLERIRDFFWPRLSDPLPCRPKCKTYIGDNNQAPLSEVAEILSYRLEQLRERDETVQTKLVALLTLTSVLSVMIAASLTAVATIGKIDEESKFPILIGAILIAFVAFQIARALWCTISGLTRREYSQLSPAHIAPKRGETSDNYRIRAFNKLLNQIRQNDWVVDRKVDDMAMAHIALQNAMMATFVIITLAVAFLFFKVF